MGQNLSTCVFAFEKAHLQNKDEIIPYTCVVLLFMKCFHTHFAILKNLCHNNPVMWVRCVLLSHFTNEEIKVCPESPRKNSRLLVLLPFHGITTEVTLLESSGSVQFTGQSFE